MIILSDQQHPFRLNCKVNVLEKKSKQTNLQFCMVMFVALKRKLIIICLGTLKYDIKN